MNESEAVKKSGNPFDIFAQGARKGVGIVANNLMPNMIMAYVLTDILHRLGILTMIGNVFGPLMVVFGLPGEAVVVLLTTWLSSSAAIGLSASMAAAGTLTGHDITILMPAYFLLNAQIQYMGRLLGVAGVPAKYWPLLMLASFINACCSMLLMHWFFT